MIFFFFLCSRRAPFCGRRCLCRARAAAPGKGAFAACGGEPASRQGNLLGAALRNSPSCGTSPSGWGLRQPRWASGRARRRQPWEGGVWRLRGGHRSSRSSSSRTSSRRRRRRTGPFASPCPGGGAGGWHLCGSGGKRRGFGPLRPRRRWPEEAEVKALLAFLLLLLLSPF